MSKFRNAQAAIVTASIDSEHGIGTGSKVFVICDGVNATVIGISEQSQKAYPLWMVYFPEGDRTALIAEEEITLIS